MTMSLTRYVEMWKERQPPSWTGPKQCVDSKDFISAYRQYECSDKGYIRSSDIFAFAETLLYNVHEEGKLFAEEKNKFQVQLFHYFNRSKWQWVSMKDLYHSLPMVQGNFLAFFRGRRVFTSVDFMKIWKHYDPFDSGVMDTDTIWAFSFDLLSSPEQKFDPRVLKFVVQKVLELCKSENGEIDFHQMECLLQSKNLVKRRFPNATKISKADLDEVFALYDKNDDGRIGGEELRALIKDLEEFYGKTPRLNNINDQVAYMLIKADHNRDGVISMTEIKDLFVL